MASLHLFGPEGERQRRKLAVLGALVLAVGLLATLGAASGRECRTDLDLVVGGETTTLARDAGADVNPGRPFYYVAAADFPLVKSPSVLANTAGRGQHLVGLELRGAPGHVLAAGDTYTTTGDANASFSLLTQVDERFSSFSAVDPGSRVRVLSASRRSMCLEVRFDDEHMHVEGTIRALIREHLGDGVQA
jgi:hypothetical protein